MGVKVEREKRVKVKYRDEVVGEYIADIVVEDKVIIELKNAERIISVHKAQLLNYLRASSLEVWVNYKFC